MSGECDKCGEHSLDCKCWPNELETLFKPKIRKITPEISMGDTVEFCDRMIDKE